MTLRIVADENMPNVEAWFSTLDCQVVRKPGRTLTPEDLNNTDVLLVRSITQVNESLLAGTPVKFVGSATIGTDHIDQAYLKQQNIPFHYAPGCNAQSVADWLLAILARLTIDVGLLWWQKTIAVVGVGNVGSTVVAALEPFGCHVLLCDPLKYDDGTLPEHESLESVMSKADIVCLHTPQTKTGLYPTHQMIGLAQLQRMKPNAWLINAGRGPVCQRDPLFQQASAGAINLVLDVWPEEPMVDAPLLGVTQLASPHVAGYSLEGKYKGTEMLALAVAEHFQLGTLLAPDLPEGIRIDAALYQHDDIKTWACSIVLAVYDPARDTVTMSASMENGVITGSVFDQLRKDYPTRRELASTKVVNAPPALQEKLEKFGFIF